MAQNNSGNQKNNIEHEALLIIGFTFLLLAVLWWLFHAQLSRFFLKYDYYITYFPAWVAFRFGLKDSWFFGMMNQIVDDSWHIKYMTPVGLLSVTQKASYVLTPLAVLPLWWAYVANKSPLKTLNKLYKHWDLMVIQSKTNPCIIPVVKFTEFWQKNNIERHERLFRALNPDEFADKFNLINKSPNDWELNFVKSKEIFEEQIGELFDASKMQIYKKALAVIFMTRIIERGEEGRKKGRAMLDGISKSCNPLAAYAKDKENPNFELSFDFSIAKQFDNLIKHELIADILCYFKHETTFLMRLLSVAREDGKLPPADFIWLKLVDRPIWYALYGVSKTLIAKGYPEGSGPMGQYWSAMMAMENSQVLVGKYTEETIRAFESRLFAENMVSERKMMTERERKREEEFGRIPEIS
jgi:intracellular multiplication protein IcmP